MQTMSAPYVTIQDLARRYPCTETTVRNWLRRGLLGEPTRVGKRLLFPAELMTRLESRDSATK